MLQILTSDTTDLPRRADPVLRARWRIENLFKYLDFYGIDYLADYHATIEPTPARSTTRTQDRSRPN